MDRKEQIARIIHELHECRAFLACAYDLADGHPSDIEQIQDFNANLNAAEGNLEKAAAYFSDIKIYHSQN